MAIILRIKMNLAYILYLTKEESAGLPNGLSKQATMIFAYTFMIS